MTKGLRQRLQQERGHPFVIFANDNIGITINQFGLFEHIELQLLRDFLRPIRALCSESIALDIGANIGNHALFLSKLFFEVHAFEPNPLTYQLLKINAAFATNVIPHDHGLGNIAGTYPLSFTATNAGGSSIIANAAPQDRMTEDVKIEVLDDCFNTEKEIKLIKIDTEGFETNILIGAIQTIMRHRPLILFEQHINQFSAGSTPAIDILQKHAYVICWLERKNVGNSTLSRAIRILRESVAGRTLMVRSGESIPVRSHAMLIALPEEMVSILDTIS